MSGIEALELRRSDEAGAAESAAFGCNPDGYTTRIKVNRQLRQLLSFTCEATADYLDSGSYSTPLLDDDFARVQEAYRALRIVSAEQCIPADSVLTLELSPEHGEPLRYGDEEHSVCPVPGLERERYVTGLDELFRVRTSIPIF